MRQTTGTSPSNYTLRQAQGVAYTGQYSYIIPEGGTADFGLMYYNARWYDPALGRFAQADTIVPGGVQGLDRYAYVNNSPMNLIDPTGHVACDDGPQTWANCKEQLRNYAKNTVRQFSGKDDLEAIVRIVDYGAFLYPEYEDMIPALSEIFLGIEESNPETLINAVSADPCAAVGREPKDCGANSEGEVFWDQGFHPDYQDGHSQAYHFWAYLATTASTDVPDGSGNGRIIGTIGNIAHEIFAYKNDEVGATWQDYALSVKAMDIGEMVATNSIKPGDLGNYIKEQVGPNSGGSPWVQPFIKYFPLKGN